MLFLMPGLGLLILSTSIRFGHYENECRMVAQGQVNCDEVHRGYLMKRAMHFRSALIFSYLALGIFAFSALVGLLSETVNQFANVASTVLGTIAVLVSVTHLILETRLSVLVVTALIPKGNTPDA